MDEKTREFAAKLAAALPFLEEVLSAVKGDDDDDDIDENYGVEQELWEDLSIHLTMHVMAPEEAARVADRYVKEWRARFADDAKVVSLPDTNGAGDVASHSATPESAPSPVLDLPRKPS